ncbi:hypothetical protein RHMOL_Rhmol13G0068100 [Rhododendron molle]|uniref:Uncharacterized protein n=1 Tax=Rhododendron molle TaxID=49168 RepID=A0ACC0L3P9_RHOML|nr:hypothetical protein RHMOL_Rhmol13G0068100 [Rhododendron molle]
MPPVPIKRETNGFEECKFREHIFDGTLTLKKRLPPERWKVAVGNVVYKRFFNCLGCLCFESIAKNCKILQSKVNKFKANKDEVDPTQLKGSVYGDAIRPRNQCRCRIVAEINVQSMSMQNFICQTFLICLK